jgi:hypothetical protein
MKKKRNGLVRFMALLMSLTLLSMAVDADPATRSSEKVERFGYWYVVKKPATYVDARTGRRGRYTLCSAVLFARTASLEFEAKNDRAWSFYVAKEGWDYPIGTRKLTLSSGSQEIQIPAALYGGSMISGMSHDLLAGRPISMDRLRSFISEGEPISLSDSQGKARVTFPNKGPDLLKAFDRAIRCSLANAPR